MVLRVYAILRVTFLVYCPCCLPKRMIKPFSKKCDNLGTKNEKIYLKNTVLKKTDIQVLKNSTLHHKIPRLGGGGLLQNYR